LLVTRTGVALPLFTVVLFAGIQLDTN